MSKIFKYDPPKIIVFKHHIIFNESLPLNLLFGALDKENHDNFEF